jgi:hypothetical protein
MQPVVRWDSTFAGGELRGELRIDRSTLDQLRTRRAAWPLPWTHDDSLTTWLVPERLLLWAPFASADDRWTARLLIDGQPVEMVKAYTAIHHERRTFTGFYADISRLTPETSHSFVLELPSLARGQFLGLYFENVETEYVRGTPVP